MDKNQIEVERKHLQFKHPFTALAAGPSGSGKTQLIRSILEDHSTIINGLNKKDINVIWAYGKWQNVYEIKLKNVNFKYINGIPEEDDIECCDIIVIDDLMTEIKNSKFVLDLFTKGSHHNNQSVFILTQNLYHKGPIVRDLNLNSHYLIIFKSPRDKMQIKALAKQIYPNASGYFMSAYEQSTSAPHGYLIVDLKQDTPDDLRLKTRIIPSEESQNCFEPFGFIQK
jgi:hypothetical protein